MLLSVLPNVLKPVETYKAALYCIMYAFDLKKKKQQTHKKLYTNI